jgi:hypothetical protein
MIGSIDHFHFRHQQISVWQEEGRIALGVEGAAEPTIHAFRFCFGSSR